MMSSTRSNKSGSNTSIAESPRIAVEFDYDTNIADTKDIGLADVAKFIHRSAVYYLHESLVGLYWDLLHVLLSFVSLCFYIFEMYAYAVPSSPLPSFLHGAEITLTILFTADLLLSLLAAERKLQYMASAAFILDVASISPIVTWNTVYYGEVGVTLQFLRVVRLFRCVRLMQAAAGGYHRRASNPDASVRRQILILVSNVSTYILVCAGLVHASERTWPGTFAWVQANQAECDWEEMNDLPPSMRPAACTLDLFTALYFTLITTLTVGFGDIYPVQPIGRVVVLAILLPMFIIVPSEAARLLSLLSNVSKYTRGFPGSPNGHIILCGELAGPTVYSFLSEWYHTDHGDQKLRVVLIHPSEPDATIKAALDDPRFDQKVQYIKGSPFHSSDLTKAAIFDAKAVFVQSTRLSGTNPMMADASALLAVRILKTTCPWVPVYLQLVSPALTVHTWAEWDTLVCSQELKYALMAKSVTCPGFNTLIANLLTSSSSIQQINVNGLQKGDRAWIKEYVHGSGQELYTLNFAPGFNKQFFNVAAHMAYVLWGVIIVGVETQQTRRKPVEEDILSDPSLSQQERAKRLAQYKASQIGLESRVSERMGDDEQSAEARYHKLLEERRRQADLVVLINPKHYCIRTGDKAIIIAEDSHRAQQVQLWDGAIPFEDLETCAITSADRRTFARLNKGRGPYLKDFLPHLQLPQSVSGPAEAADISGAPPVSSANDTGGGSLSMRRFRSQLSGIGSRLLGDARHMSGHVIVCGPGVGDHLRDVLWPLCLQAKAPIVVLFPVDGSEMDAAVILMELGIPEHLLANTFLINGSSIKKQDLERAGIETASAVAIVVGEGTQEFDSASLSSAEAAQNGVSAPTTSSKEVQALFTVCMIESEFPHCRIILEVASASSLRYLLHKPHDEGMPRQLWPQYASGRTFVTSALSNLLVLSYYNSSLMPILKKLIDPTGQAIRTEQVIPPPDAEEEKQLVRRRFTLLQNSRQSLPVEKFLDKSQPENNHMVHMAVPPVYVGRAFADLFAELAVTKGIICIGVFRSDKVHDAPLPYVITNPPPHLRLHAEDLLFALVGEEMLHPEGATISSPDNSNVS